jgi:hypothetical protein
MSMHKTPLTAIEETGMLTHWLGNSIGKPSQAADLFRAGVAWGLMPEHERTKSIQNMLKHSLPTDPEFRQRLQELLGQSAGKGGEA